MTQICAIGAAILSKYREHNSYNVIYMDINPGIVSEPGPGTRKPKNSLNYSTIGSPDFSVK